MKNVALITGASSGIGKELARIHASKGGDLIIVARSRGKLEELKQELESQYSTQVMVIEKDLAQAGAGREVYDEVKEAGEQVDFLINNAGFGGVGKFHEREWQKDLDMINLNIVALTELTRCFLPDMVKRNRGKILNVSSTASLLPGPLQAVYYATKAYVTSFSNAIAEELHDTNITVTALMPGATETSFGSVSGMDKTEMFKDTANPETVAKDGYQAMLDGKLDVISGVPFVPRMMLKMLPFTPKKMMLSQVRKMQEIK
ncbi:MAG: short-chain dehydrogenase [Owenweeksia sp.]|nr:short-chain dehydrogenase [Owenweeksia sp.]MBF98641.1 short-chain dehydrogenase [Owenweeksia sp.]HBF21915.1 short-chain dehydrogenase [Cryomorphaceae bacterium]HCQ16152.1 short-chain dehydrogenase [Cryomorphaceae bacterium]|tara:strand:+ start:487 stop:1266 length:780 start_codon:yes stop_codon:yes gene_type:complete